MIEVPLTQGYVAMVDDRDAWVLKHAWQVYHSKNGRGHYARRSIRDNGRNITVLLHREILGLPVHNGHGQEVDHRDGNGLNNRRRNLRAATTSQNMANMAKRSGTSSHYKGVSQYRGSWQATIKVNYRQKWLGAFDSEIDAARAYDVAARKAFGEFASINNV